jgi:phosphonate transport system permease protein
MLITSSQLRLRCYFVVYAALLVACAASLVMADDLSLGRNPWRNLVTTVSELSRPSFVDVWLGNPQLEYKSDDGRVLRVENQKAVEVKYLYGLIEATWTTLKIATLGSLIAAILALPLGILSAKNMQAPRPLAWMARIILDVTRSIHALVFGLLFVGIIGLGPTAGILAIAAHSLGSYGKLYAESIETIDPLMMEAGLSLGGSPMHVLVVALWRAVLPKFMSIHLYVWEFNVRDSTVLGLIGAGGLGLLVSEATSLFQWGRLATVMLTVIILVSVFDQISRRIRADLLRSIS